MELEISPQPSGDSSSEASPLPPVRYVTFDSSGALTGCYYQALRPDHVECSVLIAEAVARTWPSYRANAARDGLELVPPPAPQPPPVPQQVTRRQARQALLLAGVLDSVEPAINSIPDITQRRLAMIEWQDSQVFERQRPLVINIGGVLGLDLDDLFTYAATL